MNQNKIILLIEDNVYDIELTLHVFQSYHIANRILVMRNGIEALDYLFRTGQYSNRDPNEWPQVILLDLKLPKIDGLEVLQRIRANEKTKSLPVVVFTSSKEQEDLIRSYNLGAHSFIQKPVNFEQFAEALCQLGLYWLVLNEPSTR